MKTKLDRLLYPPAVAELCVVFVGVVANASGLPETTVQGQPVRAGVVVAWKRNDDGQCEVPLGLSNVVEVAGGLSQSLALETNGMVVVWGARGSSQGFVPPGLSNVVAISAGYRHNLALKADGTNLVWQTWCDAPWVPITSTSPDGQDCARSGQIGDSGVSALTTTTTGPGLIQFAWRPSREMFGDWFDFVVDGVVSDALAGESAWKYVDVEIGAGVHTLSWEYWKNESGVAAADTVWPDCVVWTPYGSTVTDTTPVPVPYAWLDGYPALLASCGGDYEAAALLETVKRDSGGSSLAVWQDHVAGTCPTSAVSLFRCFIEK